ncbi:hypothetical protein [Flaviaesturariibacter terrae]
MKNMLLAAGLIGTAIAGLIIAISKDKTVAQLPAARGTHAMG